MVMDGQKHKRGFGPRHSEPPETGMRPEITSPLGPGMAYGRWGQELERQRIIAATRSACLSLQFPQQQLAP